LAPGTADIRLLTSFEYPDAPTVNTFVVASDVSLAPASAGAGGASYFVLANASDATAALDAGAWDVVPDGSYAVWVPGFGYQWTVTFTEVAHVGDQIEMMALPGTGWAGTNINAAV